MKLTTRQVARALGVSEDTVLNYTKRTDKPLIGERAQRGLRTRWKFDVEEVMTFACFHDIPIQLPQNGK